MFSLAIVFLRLIRRFKANFKDPEFRALSLVALTLLISGTIFYSRTEGWSILDSLYFCVITLATVGYGDLTPQTDLGKIFTIVYIFIGVGTLFSFITLLARKRP